MIKIILPLTIFTSTLCLDIFTKKLANDKLTPHKKKTIYKRVKLLLVKNKGAALNALSHHRKLLLFINLIIFGFLCVLFKKSYLEDKLLNLIALSFVISGGVGNNIERITKGEVTDFLYFEYKKLPVYNFADFNVYIGLILLLLLDFNDRL
ncbi:MAG: signal peptidase II [Lachnospirales bacterium]